MSRIRQRTISIVGVLLASLGLLVLGVVIFRNPILNSALVRKEISAALQEEIGRKVDLSGALRIDEWPWVELDVGRGSIANPPGFKGPPLVQWDLIEMRFHYSTAYEDEPLLYGIVVHGLKVNLHIDAAGRDNFSDLGSRDPTPPAVPLKVPRVEIRNAALSFTDERVATAPRLTVDAINLKTGNTERGAGPVDGKRWRIADIELSAQPLDLETIALSVPAVAADVAASAAQIPAATIRVGPVRLRLSDLAVAAPADSPLQASGRFALDPVPIAALFAAVGQQAPFASDSPWFRLRGLSGSLRQTEEGLLVDDLRLSIDDVRLNGSVSVGRKIRFVLKGNRLDLDRYIGALADNSSAAPSGGFPGKTLLGLPLEGTVSLDSAVSGGLRMREVTLKVTDRDR